MTARAARRHLGRQVVVHLAEESVAGRLARARGGALEITDAKLLTAGRELPLGATCLIPEGRVVLLTVPSAVADPAGSPPTDTPS